MGFMDSQGFWVGFGVVWGYWGMNNTVSKTNNLSGIV